MSVPVFQRIRTEDTDLSRVQDNASKTLDAVVAIPLMGGLLLQGVVLINGTTTVSHKLGRSLVGWVTTRRSAAATIYDTQATSATPGLTLTLVSNALVTVDLWVF
jgi:hypothetical protein